MSTQTSAPTRSSRPLTAAQQTKVRTHLIAELQHTRDLEARLRLEISEGIETRRGAQADETDDPEGASLAFEGAQAAAMLKDAGLRADEIIAALERLERGTYGTCVECDTLIARGRLEARPATCYCIDCAS